MKNVERDLAGRIREMKDDAKSRC